jgi:hypothetical protein
MTSRSVAVPGGTSETLSWGPGEPVMSIAPRRWKHVTSTRGAVVLRPNIARSSCATGCPEEALDTRPGEA